MKIDKGIYNKNGYKFVGKYSDSVQYWFDLIYAICFIGNPPYSFVWLAYALRKITLFFYKKHNTI